MSEDPLVFRDLLCPICSKNKYLIRRDLFGKDVDRICFYWEKYFKQKITINYPNGSISLKASCKKYVPNEKEIKKLEIEKGKKWDEDQSVGRTTVVSIYKRKEKNAKE